MALLEELGRADTATLARLFGLPSAPAELPAEPGPTWPKPGASDDWQSQEPVLGRQRLPD
jgi:hypothetical protein